MEKVSVEYLTHKGLQIEGNNTKAELIGWLEKELPIN